MKKGLLFSLLICFSFGTFAQQYPSEWVKYTSDGYLTDIQNGRNDTNIPDTEFKNNLLDAARANLAKFIRMRVEEVAALEKHSVDGRTSIVYSSETRFSTDVDLKLVETKMSYDPQTGDYYAMAYIDKEAARTYYKNVLMMAANKADHSIELARSLISSGFKAKARQELEKSSVHFASMDEPLFWMNIFGTPQEELDTWQRQFSRQEQTVKRMLSDLQYGIRIYLSCQADLFGVSYPTLQNELKGLLSSDSCSFTDDKESADWIIAVTCHSREHAHVVIGGVDTWISYVDAVVTIDKSITSQRIVEDEISIKGGHTHDYREAARAAYKELKKQLKPLILQNIQ